MLLERSWDDSRTGADSYVAPTPDVLL